jgi:hypothetical protein
MSGRISNPPGEFGPVSYNINSVTCQNNDCSKMTLGVAVYQRVDYPSGHYQPGTLVRNWGLMPESDAKPQPDFIPKALVEDYTEACRIRDLSPKASATLARRCLQGMIRDFCKDHEGDARSGNQSAACTYRQGCGTARRYA